EKISVDMAEGGRISGGRKDLQYHRSLLLRRADRTKLQKVLKRFSAEWEGKRQIECTGPWPPYSFVSRLSE
ncbi:MAG TPA: GvpL/GvpF family gas vesicle protein, partial [Terriglobales bacterium]|nr:GvpL/GvpF family gas vesicle protein [Terriglobales bacterium]